MKNSIFKSILFFVAAAFVFAGCNVTSHTQKMAGINFNNYKTFAWANPKDRVKTDRSNNDIVDNNIKNSVSAELVSKGWTETDNNPDVLMGYTIAVRQGNRLEDAPGYGYPFTNYMWRRGRIYSLWYPYSLWDMPMVKVPFSQGELTVNMIDAKTNKLIWQGWATGDINDHHFTSKEVSKQVKSIFKKFDFPGGK